MRYRICWNRLKRLSLIREFYSVTADTDLSRAVEESGKTVLFITHSIDEALILSERLVVMSARPGQVKAIYDNDLPRPRRMEVQITERFLELKREVWPLVQEEVLGSIKEKH